MQQAVQSSFRQDFKWGVPVKVDNGARTVTAAVGWPRVQVLQKTKEGTGWQVLKVKYFESLFLFFFFFLI